MLAPDGGDDLVWVFSPAEGTQAGVGFPEEAVDSGLEVNEGMKHAAFQPPLGQFGEEAFDRIEP